MTPAELLVITSMNKDAFGAEDDYSKLENVQAFLSSGGHVGVVRDSRNPDALLAYFLSVEVKGIGDLVRYAVHRNYKGKGLAKKVLAEFWKQHQFATTYVSTNNRESFHALLSSGFRYFTTDANFIYLVGYKL